jgi:hypothetical protein
LKTFSRIWWAVFQTRVAERNAWSTWANNKTFGTELTEPFWSIRQAVYIIWNTSPSF